MATMRVRGGVGRVWMRGALLPLLLSFTAVGCYREVPLAGATPRPGTTVRVRLTRDGSTRLAELIGPGVVSVDGEAVAARADAWELLLTSTRLENGSDVPWRGERVELPTAYVVDVSERRLTRSGTALLIGAIGAGAFLMTKFFQAGVLGGDDGDGGDVPPG
jgi:hypothetical protein